MLTQLVLTLTLSADLPIPPLACVPAATKNFFQSSASPDTPRHWLGVGTPRGDVIAVIIDDSIWSALFVYRGESGKRTWEKPLPAEARAVAMSPDGHWLAVAAKLTFCKKPGVLLFDVLTGDEMPPLSGFVGGDSQDVTFSSDSRFLTASTNSGVTVWEAATGRLVSRIQPPGFESRRGIEVVTELKFEPGDFDISGVGSRFKYRWNWKTKALISRSKVEEPAQPDDAPSDPKKLFQAWADLRGEDWRLSAPADTPATLPLSVSLHAPNSAEAKHVFVIPPRETGRN